MTLVRRPAEPGGHSTFRRRKPKPSKRQADPVVPEVYELVMRRAEGRCEVGPAQWPPCQGRCHAHHRLPVQHGGRSTAANLLYVCETHHADLHGRPRFATLHGWLVDRRADPAAMPVLRLGAWVLLDDDGGVAEAMT